MSSLISLFFENLKTGFSPKDSFSNMKPSDISLEKMIVYIVLIGLIPGLGSALHYGYLDLSPSEEFLRENYYDDIGEFRDYQLLELKIAIYSILIAIGTILIQREGIALALRKEKPDATKDQITQVILAGITLPYVIGFSIVIGTIGYLFLAIASLYGLYVLYNGFLYFMKTGTELAMKATGLFFIYGAAIGIIIRAVVTLSYL